MRDELSNLISGVVRTGGPQACWYLAALVVHKAPPVASSVVEGREYWVLVVSQDSYSAYERALDVGSGIVGQLASFGKWLVDGLSELLLVSEAPSDGSELMWLSQEFPRNVVLGLVKSKHDLKAFKEQGAQSGGRRWYVCTVVLVEVHETGSHGDSDLVWKNSYLLTAPDAEAAYRRSSALAKEQASVAAHKCDGDVARWKFVGLSELLRTVDPPSDGATLWIVERTLTHDEIFRLVPDRDRLSVFEWERRLAEGR